MRNLWKEKTPGNAPGAQASLHRRKMRYLVLHTQENSFASYIYENKFGRKKSTVVAYPHSASDLKTNV